jgi:hypothetical protein
MAKLNICVGMCCMHAVWGEQLVVSGLQRAPGCYSSVTYMMDKSGFLATKEFFSLLPHPDQTWVSSINLLTDNQEYFPPGWDNWTMQLTTQLHLVPLLTYTPIYTYLHGTVHKHRENFVYLTTHYYVLNTSSLEHAWYSVPRCDVKV